MPGCAGPALRLFDGVSSRGCCAGETTAEVLTGSGGAQLSMDADDDDDDAASPPCAEPVALCLDCDAPRARTTTAAAVFGS